MAPLNRVLAIPAVGRAVTIVTYGLLVVALALGIAWFALPGYEGWEPAVNTLTLVAGLTGVIVERLSAQASQRRQALLAVQDELRENLRIVGDERFTNDGVVRRKVYPRLLTIAVDGALVSGALGEDHDSELYRRLYRLRSLVSDFNRRLDITEVRTFSDSVSTRELTAYIDVWARENGPLADLGLALEELAADLTALLR